MNEQAAVNGNTGTPALNKALAAVQASLPKVTKGETADVPGKDGKRGYSYKYAGLDTISAHVLPLLGAHGLSFTAKPTLNAEGRFVLAYSLKHSSGEHDDGEFPLGSGGGTPQQIGSAITYARRYSLCAVTGVAPDEDDDGEAAQHQAVSNDEDWRNLPPVNRPHRDGNGHAAATTQATAKRQQPPTRPTVAADDELLGAWASKIDEIASPEDAAPVLAELATSGLDSRQVKVIEGAVGAKVALLGGRLVTAPSAEDRGAQPVPTGKGDDGEWVQGWYQRLAAAGEDDLAGLQAQIGPAVQARTISPGKSAELAKALKARRGELQGAPA